MRFVWKSLETFSDKIRSMLCVVFVQQQFEKDESFIAEQERLQQDLEERVLGLEGELRKKVLCAL